MGSTALQRSGRRVISYDARGHGASSPAAGGDYGYDVLAADLLAVLDGAGAERALIAGASMGAHTAVRFALEHPGRVAALGLITPAFDPAGHAEGLARWDALAQGLRRGGIDGFVQAYHVEEAPEQWRETIERVLRQRLAAHEHPAAVADALEAVPRSRPFESMGDLETLTMPALVVASRDEADPGHPLRVGRAWAEAIPGAGLLVEDEGPPARSPIAWQGGQLSRALIELAESAGT